MNAGLNFHILHLKAGCDVWVDACLLKTMLIKTKGYGAFAAVAVTLEQLLIKSQSNQINAYL